MLPTKHFDLKLWILAGLLGFPLIHLQATAPLSVPLPYPTTAVDRLPLPSGEALQFSNKRAERLARLTTNGFVLGEAGTANFRAASDQVKLTLSLDEHQRFFDLVQPEGAWVQTYLYFTVTRNDADEQPKRIRYFTRLPPIPSGHHFSESLEFELEPLYNHADRQQVAPGLPDHFTGQVNFTPNAEQSGIAAILLEIQQRNMPNLDTDFSVIERELTEIGGVRIQNGESDTNAAWQCRVRVHQNDPALETIKMEMQKLWKEITPAQIPVAQNEAPINKFFEDAGIDLTKDSQSRIAYRGNDIVVRAPVEEMQKLQHLMKWYNKPKQTTTTARLVHETSAAVTRSVSASVLCQSGKRATFSVPNIDLFESREISNAPARRFEIALASYIENHGNINLIIEPRATDLFGYDSIGFTLETILPPAERLDAGSYTRRSDKIFSHWRLELESRSYEYHPAMEPVHLTEFIPISRRALAKLGLPSRMYKITDPFAHPSPDAPAPSSFESILVAALEKHGILHAKDSADPEFALAYDGEQLIVAASPAVIRRLRKGVAALNFVPQIEVSSLVKWTDPEGSSQAFEASLVSAGGDRATMTFENLNSAEANTAFTENFELTSIPAEYDGGEKEPLSAEAKVEITSQNEHAWFAQLASENQANHADEKLPPQAESVWRVEKAKFHSENADE